MDSPHAARGGRDLKLIKALTCMMFFTFAMTTDAVGSIIPTLAVARGDQVRFDIDTVGTVELSF